MNAVIDDLPLYLQGFGLTLSLFFIAGIAAIILGTVVAAMRISPLRGSGVRLPSIPRRCATLHSPSFYFSSRSSFRNSPRGFPILRARASGSPSTPHHSSPRRSGPE